MIVRETDRQRETERDRETWRHPVIEAHVNIRLGVVPSCQAGHLRQSTERQGEGEGEGTKESARERDRHKRGSEAEGRRGTEAEGQKGTCWGGHLATREEVIATVRSTCVKRTFEALGDVQRDRLR